MFLSLGVYPRTNVLKSGTLNDLERYNGRYFALFYWIRPHWRLITSKWFKIVFSNIWLVAIFAEITENECINERHPLVKDDILTNTARYLENIARLR